MKPIVAIDFESYYEGKKPDGSQVSVTAMGAWVYARRTDIYMVSMYSNEGLIYVGPPATAPWSEVNGCDWVFHNAGFDLTLLDWLIENGTVPPVGPRRVYDTADLSASLGFPRSLKEAARYLIGHEMSKGMRDSMKNRQWADVAKADKEAMARYALMDAKTTLNIWLAHGDKMVNNEIELSRMTREMGMRGVPVNLPRLIEARKVLQAECERARLLIPWRDEPKVKMLSLDAIRAQCEKEGIRAPASFDEKSEEGAEWEEEFADTYPWVRATREYRKSNKHLKTVQTMISRTRPDGRMPYELKYFGAFPGRDSGGGGWNAQNQPRGIVAGVDLRSMIEAPPGKMLVSCDLSQIEPRCLADLVKDKEGLELLAKGMPVYEAHARRTMGYTDAKSLKEFPTIYQLAKARVLGLGYGCGPDKFIRVAKSMAGLTVTGEESRRIVREFRTSNPKIVTFWRRLDLAIRQAFSEKEDLTMVLPSGRELVYRRIERSKDFSCLKPDKTGKMARVGIYGALICENITQGFARDVFMDRCIALEERGFEIIMRVHDEVVCLVDEADAEVKAAELLKIFTTPPIWRPHLPLAAEVNITKRYQK